MDCSFYLNRRAGELSADFDAEFSCLGDWFANELWGNPSVEKALSDVLAKDVGFIAGRSISLFICKGDVCAAHHSIVNPHFLEAFFGQHMQPEWMIHASVDDDFDSEAMELNLETETTTAACGLEDFLTCLAVWKRFLDDM